MILVMSLILKHDNGHFPIPQCQQECLGVCCPKDLVEARGRGSCQRCLADGKNETQNNFFYNFNIYERGICQWCLAEGKNLNLHCNRQYHWNNIIRHSTQVAKTDLVEGTYPEGSAWRPVVKVLKIPSSSEWYWLLYFKKVVGQGKGAKYLIRRDKVKVPKNIPKGDYALSFRWIVMSSHAFAL